MLYSSFFLFIIKYNLCRSVDFVFLCLILFVVSERRCDVATFYFSTIIVVAFHFWCCCKFVIGRRRGSTTAHIATKPKQLFSLSSASRHENNWRARLSRPMRCSSSGRLKELSSHYTTGCVANQSGTGHEARQRLERPPSTLTPPTSSSGSPKLIPIDRERFVLQ